MFTKVSATILVDFHTGLEWPEIASRVDGRNTKQIRDRWNSKLDPELKSTTEPWTEDEDALLYHAVWKSIFGRPTPSK